MYNTTSEHISLSPLTSSYLQLPERFYQKVSPTAITAPRLRKLNTQLAKDLALDLENIPEDRLASYFSGNTSFKNAPPIALAYAGHQFGSFVNQLGDGRAHLVGEATDKAGKKWDIQLKGSGRTKFSRGGDGRSALGPVIREYLVSEAMHHLGVPTTRALAMVTTGEDVFRQQGPIPGGILTRVSSGFTRIGTFEYFSSRNDLEAISQLSNYVIKRHYPQAEQSDAPCHALFKMVCENQARLVAQWMLIGFIHGVMNTDNTAICGETIDYGPCAFMDTYDPNTVFSAIDVQGRYRFINQGPIITWNLGRFGLCLLPFLDEDPKKAEEIVNAEIESFQHLFMTEWQNGMFTKMGFSKAFQNDIHLLKELLGIMLEEEADYTLTFRYLSDNLTTDTPQFAQLFTSTDKITGWLIKWRKRITQEDVPLTEIKTRMDRVNPAFIPRNHQIEKAIQDAEQYGDFEKTHLLYTVLSKPYEFQEAYTDFMKPPRPEERVLQTFCGT